MMPIILLILGLFFLFRKNYVLTLTIIVLLASTYLQMPFRTGNFWRPETYNVYDIGIILFLLFFVRVGFRYGYTWVGKLQNLVTIFLLFIIVNGIYDCWKGTSVGDVLKYCRQWTFLLTIYIYPTFPKEYTLKSFKQIYYITMLFCIFLIVSSLMGIEFEIMRSMRERGVKPPSYSMIFAVAALVNFFGQSKRTRILHSLIFVAPIVMNLKMTYAVSCVLIFGIYIFFNKNSRSIYKIATLAITIIGLGIFFTVNERFANRFNGVVNETNTISQGENSGNFSYRILHAEERLHYILKDPIYTIRGIGYVQEKNFKKKVFLIGTQTRKVGVVHQLDTGDIAWSLFFIRLGLFGLFLYLWMYLALIRTYFKHRKDVQTTFMFAFLLTFLIFTSLGNSIIAESNFFIYPFLLLTIIKDEDSTCALESVHGRDGNDDD